MVVLAGYADRMAEFMAADPGLPRRFALALHLPDYSAAEVAEIVALVATHRLGLQLDAGLVPWLAQHIATHHAAEIAQHNGGLAVRYAAATLAATHARLLAYVQRKAALAARRAAPWPALHEGVATTLDDAAASAWNGDDDGDNAWGGADFDGDDDGSGSDDADDGYDGFDDGGYDEDAFV